MADALANNAIALRICILYEFTKGKKPFEIYKSMMRMFGKEFMTYPEFEFWYMRFHQGNFDLDHDISSEPKKRQITDLPVEIFEKVGESLDFGDRAQLRLVSKDIQFLVDNWNPKVTEFTYYSFYNWSIVQNSKKYICWRKEDRRRPNPLPAVVRILKNPKLRLKKLFVTKDAKWKIIEEELRKSSIKLHVNHLTVRDRYTIDFSLLAPESLEKVSLHITESSVATVNKIVHMEHFKQLKMLTISTCLGPSYFPFGSFLGIPRFTIMFSSEKSSYLKVAKFIKTLMTCPELEFCKLKCAPVSSEPFKKHFNRKDTLVPDCPNIRRYPVQGSTDFYEINIGDTSISVERKS